MSENGPATRPSIQECLRVSDRVFRKARRLKRWRRKLDNLKKPEKVLEDDKTELKEELSKARDVASSYVRPDQLELHNRALDDIISCADRLRTLEPGCECKVKERQENYTRQVVKLTWEFPERDVRLPEDTHPSSAPSPTLSTESQLGEDARSPPCSGGAGDDSTGVPVSPPSSASFTPTTPGANRNRSSSSGPNNTVNGVEHASEAAPESSAIDAAVTAHADGKASDNARPAAGDSRVTNNKRKAAEPSLMCTLIIPPKRPRPNEHGAEATVMETANDDDRGELNFELASEAESAAGSEAESDYEAEASPAPDDGQTEIRRFASQPDIEFDELYQGGNAHFKHQIVLYRSEFYILRCDECPMHFSEKPINGAAAHINRGDHGKLSRKFPIAIQACGIRVLNCNLERQRANNEAYDAALDNGYVPRNNPQAARKRAAPQQEAATASKTRHRKPRTEDGLVLNPVPGEIYIAHWTEYKQDGVIVLPRGDAFGDPTFADVGLAGSSLAEDTDLLHTVPECYRTCPDTGKLIGWQDGYEDGGERVCDRWYPVMRFDGVPGFRKVSVDWIPVTDLREYNPEILVGTGGLIANAAHIRKFEKERDAARAAARRQREDAAVQDRRSVTTEPQLPDSTPPRPAERAWEEPGEQYEDTAAQDRRSVTTESDLPDYTPPPPAAQSMHTSRPPPGVMDPNATATADQGLEARPTDGPDERRNGEGDSAVPDPARIGMSTAPPLHNLFLTSAAIRPNPQNIVGHAATMGSGVPSHQHALGSGGRGDRLAGQAPGLQSVTSATPNHNHGLYSSLGSESAALMSHSIPPGFHTLSTAETEVLSGNPSPLSLPLSRQRVSAAATNSSRPRAGRKTGGPSAAQGSANSQSEHAERPIPGRTDRGPVFSQGPVNGRAGPSTNAVPPGPLQASTGRNPAFRQGAVNGQAGPSTDAVPPGPRRPSTGRNSTVRPGPANGQAGPYTDAVPPGPIQPSRTSRSPSHPQQSGGTQHSPIVVDDPEEPVTKHSLGRAKRTPNGYSPLGPFKRSFDHKAEASQGTTPGQQPQHSAPQPSWQGSSQHQMAWMTAGVRSMAGCTPAGMGGEQAGPSQSMPAAPEAEMEVMPDPSEIDFGSYIHEPQGI